MPAYSIRRARADLGCDWRICADRTIKAGDLYVRGTAFPGDEGFEDAERPQSYSWCEECADSNLAWIRLEYDVPAYFGQLVRAKDSKESIRIFGSDGCEQLHTVSASGRFGSWHPADLIYNITDEPAPIVAAGTSRHLNVAGRLEETVDLSAWKGDSE